jgi:hypothetical protein
LVVELAILPYHVCAVKPGVINRHRDLPLKTLRLKHVSAATVTCLGGGAGNESVYAEALPKGGAGMLMNVSAAPLRSYYGSWTAL